MYSEDRPHHDMSESESRIRSVRFPPWLITYSDLITLLLTFFILLLSMADLDPVRFTEASNSLKGALGIETQPAETTPIVPVFPLPHASVSEQNRRAAVSRTFHDLELAIEKTSEFAEQLRVIKPDADSLLVRIDESLLFEPENDVLLPSALPLLDVIARGVKGEPIDIRIEGHTDDSETGADSRTNRWELSTARAVSVLRYFVRQRTIPLERLSAIGYGGQKPVVANTSASNRALNRRVDILLHAYFTSGTTPAMKPDSPLPL